MSALRRLAMTVAFVVALLGVTTPALADDPVCREETDQCVIVVNVGGKPAAATSKGGAKDATPVKKVVPKCSDFAGGTVVANVGTSPSEMLPEDRPDRKSVV